MRKRLAEKGETAGNLEEKIGRLKSQAKSLREINDVFDKEKAELTRELRQKAEEIVEMERR